MFRERLAALKQAFPLSWQDYFIFVPGCLASVLIMAMLLNWENSGIFVPVLAFLTFWLFQARLITGISAFRQHHPELLSDNPWQNIVLLLAHFRYPLLLLAFAQLGTAIHWREYGFYYVARTFRDFESSFVTFTTPSWEVFYAHYLQYLFSYSLILLLQAAFSGLSIAIALRYSKLTALKLRCSLTALLIVGWVDCSCTHRSFCLSLGFYTPLLYGCLLYLQC
jgi:hypothetical protein